ncbi:MobA/MobL family protein [Sulfitobacter sp.]|uniref:MobA/MobL family protein n=1 Tax=Sulfitobacter sp. TaxID=1903071 RepID=UPI00329858A5
MNQFKLHPASHCPLIVMSRSDGRSSVAAAAYASRTRMTDQRTGLIYNYKNLHGLLRKGLVNWEGGAEELWNAAEASETRINARVARELRPALPAELPLDEQRRLVNGFCLFLKDRYGVACHWVIHAPTFKDRAIEKRLWPEENDKAGQDAYEASLYDPDITNLNFHAHIRWTTREVDMKTGAFGKKTRKLDDRKTGPEEVKLIRAEWQKRTNAALERVGSKARIDLRSYEAMAAAGDAPEGLHAQEHVGPLRTAITRAQANVMDEPMVAVRNAVVRNQNEERWDSWFELRYLAREKARLNGGSARIADENERQRQGQAETDKQKISAAKNDEERFTAISEAGSIDTPSAACPLEAAKRWAASSEELPDDGEAKFDWGIDLEAAADPSAPPPPGEKLRVKRVNRDRQRRRS